LLTPAESEEVESVAPPVPFNEELPSEVVPSIKVTVPVGVPEDARLTVAVRMRLPDCELLVSAVVVLAFCTIWLSTEELALSIEAPP
jgi:hypothetical protein